MQMHRLFHTVITTMVLNVGWEKIENDPNFLKDGYKGR